MSTAGPNEQLSTEVVNELIKAGLIKPARVEQVRAALSNGKCRASDWKIWAEDYTREENPKP